MHILYRLCIMNLVTAYNFLNHIPEIYIMQKIRDHCILEFYFKTLPAWLYRYQKVFSGPDMLLTLLCTISFQFS